MADIRWTDVDFIVRQLGGEGHLARGLERARRAKGWSQERLSKELTSAGMPMHQSAISKIERPANGGRRAVTVDEALALARVLDLTLAELVLPDGALLSARAAQALADGPRLLEELDRADAQVRIAVATVVTHAGSDDAYAQGLVAQAADLARRRSKGFLKEQAMWHPRERFLGRVLDELRLISEKRTQKRPGGKRKSRTS